MCGIAGILSFDAPPDRAMLWGMTRALIHRGPDDEGIHLDGPCGLGFRRLSIIDLSGGHQPMTAEHATVVFNGEIYNFRELRLELESFGHRFFSSSDTEALLRAYLQWGEDFVSRLDGMFAFALWDAKLQKLVCARDRFGKKPLYWTQVGRTFLFASELKALLQHRLCPRAIDPTSVRRYLAFDYVPEPESIFTGVKKLRAAHRMVVSRTGVAERRYWEPPPVEGTALSAFRPGEADDAAEALKVHLQRAVRRRLVADVPLGVFLSGGIDSSAVTAAASREVSGLKTFSIAFEEASYDESRYARLVAQTFGTDHHEDRLSARACLELVPTAAEQLDEPFADHSYFPTFLLSRFARRQVTVALGGDGADELFGGYDTFVAHPAGAVAAALPSFAHRAMGKAAALIPKSSGYMSLDFRVKTFLGGLPHRAQHRHQAWIGAFTPDSIHGLLRPEWRAQGDPVADVYGPIERFAAECRETGLDWALRYYLSLYMKDDILVKVDRASMATSLEVRAPFLDTALAEFVLRLPWTFKVRGWSRKWLLKRALRGWVPEKILFRQKHGFSVPVAAWLRGELRPLVEDLLSESSLREAGIFEPDRVRALVAEHVDGRADHRKRLWALLMFELWRRRWAAFARAAEPIEPVRRAAEVRR